MNNNDIHPIMCALIFILALSLIGFAVYAAIDNELNRITEGVIVDKEISTGYTDAHFSENGGQYHSYQTQYYFKLQGDKEGEIVEYWLDVSADEYSTYKVGDYYVK